MASGAETTQKLRRPTAFEVSFPNELSGDEDDENEGEVDEDAADVQISRQGKRKHDFTAGSHSRVRFALVLPPFGATHSGWEV